MDSKILKNVNGFDLTPTKSILKLIYPEAKIIDICKKYISKKVGVDLDFNVDIYSDYNDGASTTEFSFGANFDELEEYELELLNKAEIYEEELLETILIGVFNNPSFLDISVYVEYNKDIMFEIEIPLNHLDKLTI